MRSHKGNTLILFIFDLLLIDLCILGAFIARSASQEYLGLVPLGHGLSLYLLDKAWIPPVIAAALAYRGSYGTVMTVWDELLLLLKGLFISFLVVWVILSLQKEAEAVSRIVITLSFIFMAFLIPLGRMGMKFMLYKIFGRRRQASLFERRRGDRMNALKDSLNKEWYSGYAIVNNLYLDSLKGRIDTCFVPMEYADEETVKALKHKVDNMILVSSISGLSFMNTEIRTFLTKNIALITTNNGLLSRRRVVIKRITDVLLSAAGLILFLPFFLLIPILIKIDSRGPVFFVQRRCGINLAQFKMIKYRTMKAGGEAAFEEYLNGNEQALKDLKERNKLKADPRVTRIGRILRRTSLDELPQFLNVMKGDMSLVGPRPDLEGALEEFRDSYRMIYSRTKPGMTGLWQVSGRSDTKYAERVKLDYLYVLNWSIWLDVIIMLKTVRAIFGGKGAY
ncbi:MAG TPA: exopolysaccharide biosynthesis polyprenyl glycosylphosphotransferase [Syntrophorhabdaceae bacterium]|jgi:undecaprenyl-phosphate galactose phosphotransferase